MKISILTSKNHPFFGFFLSKIEKKIQIDSAIIDEKNFSQKDMNLWIERTSNRIQTLKVSKTNDRKLFLNGSEKFLSMERPLIGLALVDKTVLPIQPGPHQFFLEPKVIE